MNSAYRQFIFKDYQFEPATGELALHYSFDNALHFTEKYRFDFEYAAYDPAALDRVLQALFFMAGVSYYKMYLAPEIIAEKGELDETGAAFFGKTYQRGLGEFWFVNKLDPRTPVAFPQTTTALQPLKQTKQNDGLVVGIGGGKDSLVSVEILRQQVPGLTTWSLNHRPQLTPLVERMGLPHHWVERTWDPQIMELNKRDALNGHIPISAIFACVGTIVGVLSGKRDIIVSNEQSANEPTLHYQGIAINHQYSKSQEFEQDYQAYLEHSLGEQSRYYSFLRPLSEVHIAEIFARIGFEKYHDVFSSCNRAFTHGSHHLFWDGTCSKCAFTFLALTPFVSREKLEALFSGKNLLITPDLEPTYRQLLGIEGDKPLDCVGEIKESRAAMRLTAQTYPELAGKYHFEIPADYDYRTLNSHRMPPEMHQHLYNALAPENFAEHKSSSKLRPAHRPAPPESRSQKGRRRSWGQRRPDAA